MDEEKQLDWQVKKKCGNRVVKVILEQIQVSTQITNFQATDSSLKISPASGNHVTSLGGASKQSTESVLVPGDRNRPQRNKTKIYTQFFDGSDEDSDDGNHRKRNTPTSESEPKTTSDTESRAKISKKLSTNLRTKHDNLQNPDDFCSTSTSSRKRYPEVKMACDLCKVIVCKSGMPRHYRRKHPNEKVPKRPRAPRNKNIIKKKTVTVQQDVIMVTCDFCPLSTPCKTLWQHLQTKHPEQLSKVDFDPSRTVQCDLCPLILPEVKLYMHKKIQHSHNEVNRKPIPCLQCDLCSYKYTTQKGLEMHIIQMHVVDKPWECRICFKSFLTESRLQKHVRVYHEDTKPKCRFCPTKSFEDSASLEKHIQMVHKGYDAESIDSNLVCPLCDTWFLTHEDLVKHLKKPKSKLVMKCELCSEPVHTSCLLNLHRQTMHSDTPKASNNNCQITDAVDSAIVQLGTKTISDKIIKASSSETTKNGVPASVKNSDSPTTQFSCLVCSALFSRRCDLDLHEMQEKHRRWKCPICSKLLQKIRELKAHIQAVHSDARPFGCTQEGCRKSFSEKKTLKIHMATHATDRVHCKQCARYLAPEKFKAHVANYHEGEKGKGKFKCDVCNSMWPTQKRLEFHAVSHTNERPWPCKFCDATYKCSAQVNRHMKKCEFMSEEQKKKFLRGRSNSLQGLSKRKCKELVISYNSKKSIGKAGELQETLPPEPGATCAKDISDISSSSGVDLKLAKQEMDSINCEDNFIVYELPVQDMLPVKFEKVPKHEISSE